MMPESEGVFQVTAVRDAGKRIEQETQSLFFLPQCFNPWFGKDIMVTQCLKKNATKKAPTFKYSSPILVKLQILC